MKKTPSKNLFALSIVCCFLFLLTVSSAWAQGGKPPFVKGSKSLGISAGFGVSYDYISGYKGLPAIALTYDQGFFENIGPGTIGIGAIVAIKTARYNYSSGGYKATWNNYFIGVRGTYHLTILADKNNKFDPYAGVTLGARIYQYKNNYGTSYTDNSVYPTAGAFVGAKYNFASSFGAFAELGYDISFARVGVCLNF